ncbi:urotensin-2 [Rhinolophus sinicus]|uniref:urotensin-2 n=1 Tax=Rhinolophus sinicus TaxID=89399 RepID=UPI003D7A9709
MYKLASCWLLFIGCFNPLFSLPVLEARHEPLQFSAPDEDARSVLDELEREFLLQRLWEMLGAKGADGLRKADPSTNVVNPRGSMRKFQVFSGQDPNILLSRPLAKIRRQYKKHEPLSECFWKYCV